MHILGTSIFVEGEVDPEEIYRTCLRQAIFYDGRNISTSDVPFSAGSDKNINHILIDIRDDHGLQMMMGVWYKDGGELITAEEAQGVWHTSCSETSCSEHSPDPFRVLVGFASGLDYTDDRGWNSGNLHSGMIYNIGGFLDSAKVPWKWQEGFSKSIHEGYEDLDKLPGLVKNVQEALANPGQFMARNFLRALGFTQDNDPQ